MSSNTFCTRCKTPKKADEFKTCDKCRKFNAQYRERRRLTKNGYLMQVKMRKGVIAGKKNCKYCSCWRPVSDFSVAEWEDKRKLKPKYLSSRCHTCSRINVRRKQTDLTGKSGPYKRWITSGMTEDQRLEHHRNKRSKRYQERMKNKEYVEDLKERKRFYEDHRRRKMGLPTKQVEPSTYKRCKDDDLMPIKPFQQWIEDRLEAYESIEDLAVALDTSPRTILRWRTGREIGKNGKERVFNTIPLNTVDLALTREGNYALWELYPELYK